MCRYPCIDLCRGVSASLYSQHSTVMARVKSKHGRGGKKVDAGKVSKSSHQNGEPMVVNQGEIKVKRKQYKKECEREGCTTLARSKGLCRKHGGEPDAVSQIVRRQLREEDGALGMGHTS